MFIQDLLEDPQIQGQGAKYYPDPAEDAYFLVRRHGTQEFIKARRKIIMSMPPVDTLIKPDIEARDQEILKRLVSEYYVCGASGIFDADTDKEIKYSQNVGASIFHSDEALHLIDGVINCSMSHSNYITHTRNRKLENIKKYVQCEFDSPTREDKEDDLVLNHGKSTESYNDAKIKIDESESEIITAFYDSCKYREENKYLSKPQINEGYELHVTMTNHYDYVEIIKELDTFYLDLKIKKEKAQAEARKNDN